MPAQLCVTGMCIAKLLHTDPGSAGEDDGTPFLVTIHSVEDGVDATHKIGVLAKNEETLVRVHEVGMFYIMKNARDAAGQVAVRRRAFERGPATLSPMRVM